MLFDIVWERPVSDREYHPPFLSPMVSTTFGYGFVWGNFFLEAYGAHSVFPIKLWLDDYSDKLFGAFIVQRDKWI